MARAMKDSGIPWIGEIPEGWKIIRTKKRFTTHKDVVGDRADDYERLALTLGGVIKRPKDDAVGLQPEAFNGYQILRENELVFKLIDLANVATSRVGYSPYIGLVSPAYIILTPREKSESRYGEYYFLSLWQREVFNHMGDDGVRSSLNASDLLNVPYLAVSLDEQHRIVTFLDSECSRIDAVIEKTRASIEEYKKLKQAVITEAVTKGIRPGRKMKDSGVAWIGEIPEEWGTNKIKYISSEVGDGLHAAPEFSEDGDYYFINGNNLGEKQIKIKENTNSVSKTEYSKYNQPTLCANAILIALNGTYGLVSFYNHEKVMLGKSAGFINLFQIINRDYVRYALLSDYSKKQMDDSLAGTTIANVSLRTVRNLIITWPSNDEQIEISTYLVTKTKEFDDLLARKTEFISELESYKKSIIYEYVTGKKEVRCGK